MYSATNASVCRSDWCIHEFSRQYISLFWCCELLHLQLFIVMVSMLFLSCLCSNYNHHGYNITPFCMSEGYATTWYQRTNGPTDTLFFYKHTNCFNFSFHLLRLSILTFALICSVCASSSLVSNVWTGPTKIRNGVHAYIRLSTNSKRMRSFVIKRSKELFNNNEWLDEWMNEYRLRHLRLSA